MVLVYYPLVIEYGLLENPRFTDVAIETSNPLFVGDFPLPGLESIVGFPWVSFPVAWAPRCAPRVALLAVHLLVSDCNPLTGVELACKPIPNLWENGYVTVTKKTNGICWWCRIGFVGKVPLIGNHGVCSQIKLILVSCRFLLTPIPGSQPGNPIARWNTVIFWYVYSPALDYGPFRHSRSEENDTLKIQQWHLGAQLRIQMNIKMMTNPHNLGYKPYIYMICYIHIYFPQLRNDPEPRSLRHSPSRGWPLP